MSSMSDHMTDNVCFAIAIGALRSIAEAQPHQRSKRSGGCESLAIKIGRQGCRLRRLTQTEIEILSRSIQVAADFMDTLETEKAPHILLNLTCFCMGEIKKILRRADFDHLNRLFEIFKGSDCYSDIILGRRVFERLLAEIKIEKAIQGEI